MSEAKEMNHEELKKELRKLNIKIKHSEGRPTNELIYKRKIILKKLKEIENENMS